MIPIPLNRLKSSSFRNPRRAGGNSSRFSSPDYVRISLFSVNEKKLFKLLHSQLSELVELVKFFCWLKFSLRIVICGNTRCSGRESNLVRFRAHLNFSAASFTEWWVSKSIQRWGWHPLDGILLITKLRNPYHPSVKQCALKPLILFRTISGPHSKEQLLHLKASNQRQFSKHLPDLQTLFPIERLTRRVTRLESAESVIAKLR